MCNHPSCDPVLVVDTRGPLVESSYRGSYVIVDLAGKVQDSMGQWQRPVFVRSSLKYFQQIPLVESGAYQALGLTPRELAIACASHNGEPVHLKAVQGILKKAGLSEKHLQCGIHPPTHQATRHRLIREGRPFTPLHNNCSGKHAAFLALAVYGGYSLNDYLDFHHPVQKLIRQAISSVMGVAETSLISGIDGCSAPNYALPLDRLALGFARLADASHDRGGISYRTLRTIRDAATSHPYLIGGEDRYCTQLMTAAGDDVIGKTGAGGVYGLGLIRRKMGMAVKVESGSSGMQYFIVHGILNQLFTSHDGIQGLNKFYLHRALRNWQKITTGYRKFVKNEPRLEK